MSRALFALAGASASLAVVLAWAALHATDAAAVEATATFGKTALGGSSDYFVAERKRVNRYALPGPGSVSRLSAYIEPTGTAGQVVLKGVLYADSSGSPGALLGATQELTFKSTNAAGWYDLPFATAVKLAAGNYWIGIMSGPTAKIAGFRYDTVTGSRRYNANTFSSGPSNPFGAATTDNEQMSVYATYTSQSVAVPEAKAPPTITGSDEVGATLEEHHGSWSGEPSSYAYQWLQCEPLGGGCIPIANASAQTYVLRAEDAGHTIEVQETASNAGGAGRPAISAATEQVKQLPVPASSAPPTITGTDQVGQRLEEHHGAWSPEPTGYSYSWLRCEASGGGCTEIEKAFEQGYTLVAADAGHAIEVQETARDAAGAGKPATSAPSAVVSPPPQSATFGKTTVGASTDYLVAERKRVNRYALPVAGAVGKLSIYLAPRGISGQQPLRGVLYADAGGAPGALLGATEQITFTGASAAGWYDLRFPSPVALAAGNYWIGVMNGPTAGVTSFRYDSVPGTRDYNANAYSAGPSNPFGSTTSDSEQMSLYATYAPTETGGEHSSGPTQPQALRASAVGPSEVNLEWQPSSDTAAISGYTIRRDGAVIAQTGTPATQYSDNPLAPATTYTYTVEALDAQGLHSAQSAPAQAQTLSNAGVHHYEYVFPAEAMDVYDMDNGQALVRTVPLAGARDIRGAVASPVTHILYISYGGDGGSQGAGTLLAYDLVGERVLWTHSYAEGIDSMAISPDGRTIYMPVGESSPLSTWNVIEASTGVVKGTILGGAAPHNTIVSLDGQHVFMGGRQASYLTEADTYDGSIVRSIGPLLAGGVRPFTINGSQTLAFTTATGYLGFQVSSITSGKVLYTVPVGGNFPYTPGQPGPSTPSHGISLSPDEKQLWVMDQPNDYVHVFDVSGLPANAPKQVADIKLTRPMTGSQVGCSYDCLREGWLQHSLDGRFVYVGDSGDVIETTTQRSVANLEPLYNSRVYLEIDWSGGVPVATSSRSGVGYVSG